MNAKPGQLAGRAKMQRWNEYLAGLGARYTGNDSERRFVRDLKGGFRRLGLETETKAQTFEHWDARNFSFEAGTGSALKPFHVCSYYAYSGRTDKGGVSGPLAYAGHGTPADFAAGDFRGKIAVVDVNRTVYPMGLVFNAWDGYVPGTDPNDVYDSAWITKPPPLAAAIAAGAIAVVFILPFVAANAEGQYMPFGQTLQNLPSLLISKEVGERLRPLAQSGGASGRLTLKASLRQGKAKSLLAVLEGKGDDVVVVNSHGDGPNLIEENGPLAMLSMAQALAATKRRDRPSTYAFYVATGHFQDEVVSSPAYATEYPDLFARTKAGVTVEHLGCPEYVDDGSTYGPTGKPEVSGCFASNEKLAYNIVLPAIRRNEVTRCIALKPTPKFFGEGRGLYELGIPMMAY
ncbi:MAG: hypothetical protein F9K43_26315, partial [Bauldia sp.]